MNYEDIWQIQDEITAAVNSLGFSLWDLHFDRSSFAFHMELNEHVPDDSLSSFCSQMPLAMVRAATVLYSRYIRCFFISPTHQRWDIENIQNIARFSTIRIGGLAVVW